MKNTVLIDGIKVPKATIQKWIDALRSGRYGQTGYRLQRNQPFGGEAAGFCCLGVACQVFIPKKARKLNSFGEMVGNTPSQQRRAPRWLKQVDNAFRETAGESLTNLNDLGALDGNGNRLSMTFDEIADLLQAVYIEEVLG